MSPRHDQSRTPAPTSLNRWSKKRTGTPSPPANATPHSTAPPRFNYFITDKFEAGVALRGTEVKSIRERAKPTSKTLTAC